jgi:hypothetical protein
MTRLDEGQSRFESGQSAVLRPALPPGSGGETPRGEPVRAAPLRPRQAVPLASVCGAFGILAWVFYLYALRGDPGQDWMVFYTAARAYFDGNPALLSDGNALTAAINEQFRSWLAFPLDLHPWVYPPSFLLLFLPFGALPPAASLTVFLASGFAALFAAALLAVGRGQPRRIVAFTLLLCPAVPFTVMTGQNAFFTGSLLAGGLGLLPRNPALGGALLGVVSVKPQFWLLVPVALIAAREWRALAGTLASALVLALLSLALFGPELWLSWFALAAGADDAYRAWMVHGRLNGVSVFAAVSVLGAPQTLASIAQAAAVIAAAAVVYWGFRQPAGTGLRVALLLAATMLAAPHASASDAVLLGLAAGLYVAAPRRETLPGAALGVAGFAWVSPLFNPPSVFRAGSLTPLLILLLLGLLLAEMRRAGGIGPAAAAADRQTPSSV